MPTQLLRRLRPDNDKSTLALTACPGLKMPKIYTRQDLHFGHYVQSRI